uniref:Uncharacterized protein n=1 Tax=Anopheles aquasalis TaxID=42839 RepID=T1E844_ANOAQ
MAPYHTRDVLAVITGWVDRAPGGLTIKSLLLFVQYRKMWRGRFLSVADCCLTPWPSMPDPAVNGVWPKFCATKLLLLLLLRELGSPSAVAIVYDGNATHACN